MRALHTLTALSAFAFAALAASSVACGDVSGLGFEDDPDADEVGDPSDDDVGSLGGGGNEGGARPDARGEPDAIRPTGDAPPPSDAPTPPPPPPDAGDVCYSEAYAPTAPLDDLTKSFGDWLSTSLEVTHRRYPTGNFILTAEKRDPQLAEFADGSSFAALMESLMTMCHEETHGWDYEHSGVSTHNYVLRDDLQIEVPRTSSFGRGEILAYIKDDATSLYDGTYLEGSMGTYDFADMNDELAAYVNGLACITAVGDRIKSGISARDGAVAHLYYLQLYLKRARTMHPSVYAELKAAPAWQKFVKYEWARVAFWDAKARLFPVLQIGVDRIWAHVNAAENLDEIRKFTGREPADIACHPEK